MMRIYARHRPMIGFVILLFIMMAFGSLLGACGDDDSGLSESTATTTSAPGAASSSTSVPASQPATPSSTSTGDTGAETTDPQSSTSMTTAGAATTTTALSTTSSAQSTTTASKPSTTTTAKSTTTTAAPTTTTVKGPVALAVQGPSGVKALSMADLKAMSATSGYGGWKNQLGNITGPTSWKGVSLRSLMELVGGSGSVTVVASDGYTQTLTADQASGAVTTYDPATGEVVTGISVKAIVAYAKEGSALGSGEGPLRIAFVSSEQNQVTDSDMWVKYVVELRVD